jgi:DNA-binding phage protein
MKREAKRIYKPLSAEQAAEIKRDQKKILGEEKAEISARARKAFAEMDKARVELAHTAQLLRSEREAQNLSLADMQKRTGISRTALCRLENLVDANPTVGTLQKLAHALGKKLVVGLQD